MEGITQEPETMCVLFGENATELTLLPTSMVNTGETLLYALLLIAGIFGKKSFHVLQGSKVPGHVDKAEM